MDSLVWLKELPDRVAAGVDDRKAYTSELAGQMVQWLCTHRTSNERSRCLALLQERCWPTLQSIRQNDWDDGWPELLAAVALLIECLVGQLPGPIAEAITHTPVAEALAAAQAQFRHRVVVAELPSESRRVWTPPPSASIRYLIGAPPAITADADIEASEGWALSGPDIHDRSHTLMLGLLREGLLRDGAVAESGAIASAGTWSVGQRVGPVSGLPARAWAWWRANPGALFITGPIDPTDDEAWQALARSPSRYTATEVVEGPWVAGATRVEIEAKLAAGTAPLHAWDGEPLGYVLPIGLSSDYSDRPEGPWSANVLLMAARAAAAGQKKRRGVLIDGGPGSGKSILSRTLIARFMWEVIGTLGFAVRCDARRLARRIRSMNTRRWSSVLAAESDHPLELLTALEDSRRLVPVVDGLDELQPDQLEDVSGWLRTDRGWWIATSRPLRGFGPELPPAWRLTVDDVGRADAAMFLRSRGRDELAEAIERGGPEPPWADLVNTPLRLALLARTVEPHQALTDFDARTLYATAFEVQLRRGCRAERITDADARWLRQMVSRAVGEMALAWLDSADGALDDRALEEAFERAALGLEHQERAVAALEGGRLLVRLGTHWEFSHRTIAEWAAAEALRRRVDRRCRTIRDARLHIRAERAVLDGLSRHHEPPGSSRWRTVLRFYAPLCQAPLALLDWLVGPAQISSWRVEDRGLPRLPASRRWSIRAEPSPALPSSRRSVYSSEALDEWEFAFDVMALCRWRHAEDARTAWAIGVRRSLLESWPRDAWRHGDAASSLRRFAARVSPHLPHELGALARLAGRTAEHASRLATHPLVLLPAIPPSHDAIVWPHLDSDDPAEVEAVLAWSRTWEHPVPSERLSRLARSIADRADDAWKDVAATAWSALLDQDVEPPWPAVCARVGDVIDPNRQDEGLNRWLVAEPRGGGSPPVAELHRRRGLVFERWIRAAGEAMDAIVEAIGAAPDPEARMTLLGHVRYLLRDRDDSHLWCLVSNVARRQGWTLPEREVRSAVDGAWEVVRAARSSWDRRFRLYLFNKNLASTAIDGIFGPLWQRLPADSNARWVLLDGIDHQTRLPDVIPPMAAIRAVPGWTRIEWTVAQRSVLEQVAAEGTVDDRLLAIEALARADGREFNAVLLGMLPTGDADFDARCVARISEDPSCREKLEERGLIAPRPPSLRERARQGVPGWRDELLARLRQQRDSDGWELIEVAETHRVHEALPLLVGDWQSRTSIWSHMAAIARMATADDSELLRPVVRHALAQHWPSGRRSWEHDEPQGPDAGEALGRFLRVDDLDALADGDMDIDRHPTLLTALRQLGPEGMHRLLSLHAQKAAALRAMRAAPAAPDDSASGHWLARWKVARQLKSLAATTLATLDPATSSLARIVEVAAALLAPDPEATESERSLTDNGVDKDLAARAVRVFEARLTIHEDEWPVVESLLDHPSDQIRVFAFEACAARASAADVLPLGVRTIEYHLEAIDYATEQRRRQGWRAPPPRVYSKLVDAIRSRLRPDHDDALRAASTHHAPAIRRLAVLWAQEVAAASAPIWLSPLLGDPHVEVAEAALDALFALAPESLPAALLDLDDSAWSTSHDDMLLSRFVTRPHLDALGPSTPEVPDVLAGTAWAPVVYMSLCRAAERAAAPPGSTDDRVRSCFENFPSRAETVIGVWRQRLGPAAIDLARDWLGHDAQSVRVVARRLWLTHERHPIADLRRWLGHPEPVERFSAVECLVRQGEASLAVPAFAVLESLVPVRARVDGWSETGNGLSDLEGSSPKLPGAVNIHDWCVEPRLRWALLGSTPDFAPLLRFVAYDIPYDQQEACWTPEGDEIIADIEAMIERWGVEGVEPLVRLIDANAIGEGELFVGDIEAIARARPEGRRALMTLADAGNTTAAEMLRSIAAWDFEHDVTQLIARLEAQVFPTGWRARFATEGE